MINKQNEKETIAELANKKLLGSDIANILYKNPTSTQIRYVNDFLNTYECDILRGGVEVDYSKLEDWHLEAIQCHYYGMTPEQIAEKILGYKGRYQNVRRFLKTSLAHELYEEFKNTKDLQDDPDFEYVSQEDELKDIFKGRQLKILFWDIETSPCSSYHYNHWKVDIRQDQAIKQSHLLSISYAFNDEEPTGFRLSPEDVKNEDDLTLIVNMIEAIEEADIIVGYNSKKFDMRVLNTRALYWDLPPIKPVKHIDLYEQVKRKFKFPSNSMGNVNAYLQLEGKLINDRGLWRRCMEHWNLEECDQALIDMLTYNKQDIVATRDLYHRIKGWMTHTVNVGSMQNHLDRSPEEKVSDSPIRCSKCGSTKVAPMVGKMSYTNVKTYQMFRCDDCGGVSRISPNGLVGCPVS